MSVIRSSPLWKQESIFKAEEVQNDRMEIVDAVLRHVKIQPFLSVDDRASVRRLGFGAVGRCFGKDNHSTATLGS